MTMVTKQVNGTARIQILVDLISNSVLCLKLLKGHRVNSFPTPPLEY